MGKLKFVSFFQALLPHCYNRNRKYSKSNLNCNAIKNPQQTYLTCLEFHVIFFLRTSCVILTGITVYGRG